MVVTRPPIQCSRGWGGVQLSWQQLKLNMTLNTSFKMAPVAHGEMPQVKSGTGGTHGTIETHRHMGGRNGSRSTNVRTPLCH